MSLHRYLSLFVLGICLTIQPNFACAAPSVPNEPAPAPIQPAAQPAEKFTPEGYIKQRGAVVYIKYALLLKCFAAHLGMEGDKGGIFLWRPEKMYECRHRLQDLKEFNLNFESDMLLHDFAKTQSGKETLAQAAFLEKMRQQICGISDWIINLKSIQPKSFADLAAVGHFNNWFESKARNYMNFLKTIDSLLKQYENAKNAGKMVSTPFLHFEISKHKNKEMTSALRELSKYISYNVDSGMLFPVNNGIFLADLDYHSSQFVKNIKGCIRRMEALSAKFKRDWQRLLDMKIMDMEQMANNPYFSDYQRIPLDVKIVLHRFSVACDDVVQAMKQMAEGANPVGALLTQKNLASETGFTRNARCSYVESVRARLAHLLLNTRDKQNREVKHNIRGQLTYPDLD
ncbi:MAG: hypothetical protein IKN64_11425 [Desulfovibrio sp.]|nr:hypothetical protein [Desulfovibrio sp.]